jgi:aryl-alcohol dehydrogenase-like predicted oxidoreductase
MKFNTFPGTNELVSSIGLGTWVFGGENWGGSNDDESRAAVIQAIDLGINFIDTAPFYGDGLAETLIGAAIEGHRDKVFIATKCGVIRENGRIFKSLKPASIDREIDLSRKRLGTDIIDLYQCHWPDDETPVETTMDRLLQWQRKGAIRYIGVSNFGLDLLQRACAVAPVATLQIQYSLLSRTAEQDLLPFCRARGIGVIAYGALGGGVLSGKYRKTPVFGKWDARKMFYHWDERSVFNKASGIIEALQATGQEPSQAALNWVRQEPGLITVLAGCRTPAQVRANALSAQWDLTPQQRDYLSRLKTP